MRKIFVIFWLLFFGIFAFKAQAEAPEEIFSNMTYMIGNEHCAEEAPLVDGKYEIPRYLYVYYEDKYVYGDFNNDGLKDAAVIITESGGGSGHFRMLAFLINNGKQFIHKQSYDLGDRVIINSLKERQGKVVIDMFVHKKGDCLAGPTKRVENVYEYSGPQVWGESIFEIIKRQKGNLAEAK